MALLAGCGGSGAEESSQAAPVLIPSTSTPAPSPAPAPTPSPAPAATPAVRSTLPGINISGGEFGGVTGALNKKYTYPSNAEIDYYADLGFKLLRIPFRWERLQPTLYGPLSEVDRKALRSAVAHANARGLTVILDMHDFGRRAIGADFKTSVKIGDADVGEPALADAWTRIAEDYRGNAQVWLGLMNEPHDQSVSQWWRIAQQLVTDLRGQKVDNRLLVPGTAWTGAHNWVSSGNAAQAETLTDPRNDIVFEVHQYLDSDSSGTHATCAKGSGARMNSAIAWAKSHKARLFVGEMGASGDAQCAVEYPAMLKAMAASDVVIGWTAWGGGTWWKDDYMFKLAPLAWPDKSQPTAHMTLLLPFLR